MVASPSSFQICLASEFIEDQQFTTSTPNKKQTPYASELFDGQVAIKDSFQSILYKDTQITQIQASLEQDILQLLSADESFEAGLSDIAEDSSSALDPFRADNHTRPHGFCGNETSYMPYLATLATIQEDETEHDLFFYSNMEIQTAVQDTSNNQERTSRRRGAIMRRNSRSNKKVNLRQRSKTFSNTNNKGSQGRRPFSNITNTCKATGVLAPVPATSKPQPPTLLLNGAAPALGDFYPMDLYARPESPPPSPDLLNERWAPRGRPLTLTVYVKTDQPLPAGHRPRGIAQSADAKEAADRNLLDVIEVVIYPDHTLADLRGAIEDAIESHTFLRGAVKLAGREVFLPLLGERFFRQWMKERMREGGVGNIEAWKRNYF